MVLRGEGSKFSCFVVFGVVFVGGASDFGSSILGRSYCAGGGGGVGCRKFLAKRNRDQIRFCLF